MKWIFNEVNIDELIILIILLQDAESRAEYGEMNVQRIHLQIDQLEDELIGQKQKCKAINDELQQTFNDMVQNYWQPPSSNTTHYPTIANWNTSLLLISTISYRPWGLHCPFSMLRQKKTRPCMEKRRQMNVVQSFSSSAMPFWKLKQFKNGPWHISFLAPHGITTL